MQKNMMKRYQKNGNKKRHYIEKVMKKDIKKITIEKYVSKE